MSNNIERSTYPDASADVVVSRLVHNADHTVTIVYDDGSYITVRKVRS